LQKKPTKSLPLHDADYLRGLNVENIVIYCKLLLTRLYRTEYMKEELKSREKNRTSKILPSPHCLFTCFMRWAEKDGLPKSDFQDGICNLVRDVPTWGKSLKFTLIRLTILVIDLKQW